jgi:hypothetical protein
MSDQEILFKILDQSSQANARLAVIESKQEAQIKQHEKLIDSHYKLKNDFNNHKNKFLLITSAVGSVFGLFATWIWRKITE